MLSWLSSFTVHWYEFQFVLPIVQYKYKYGSFHTSEYVRQFYFAVIQIIK